MAANDRRNSFIIDGENREGELTLFCSLLEDCLPSGPVLRTVSAFAFNLSLSLLEFIRRQMLLQNTRWKAVGRHVYLVQNMKFPLFFVLLQLFEHHFLFKFLPTSLLKEIRTLVQLSEPPHTDPYC
jgi:hypothetical protein